jgi:hypothetical protein
MRLPKMQVYKGAEMKFYLASIFRDRPRMLDVTTDLVLLGHRVTARWIHHPPDVQPMDSRYDLHEKAVEDLDDVDKAKGLILFTDDVDGHKGGGGRHVEFGFALAKGKQLYVVGPVTSVFHHLKVICKRTDTWSEMLAYIKEKTEREEI